MKKSTYIFAGILIVVLIGVFLNKNTPNPDTSGKVKIGLALGLTGYASNWGEGEQKAVTLAYEEYKDKLPTIEFVTEDTKTTGVGTVNAIQKLVNIDHVNVVIGPTWADSFQGGYPVLNKAGIPTISSSAAFETLETGTRSKYMFSTWWPQFAEIKALALDIKQRGYKRLLLIHDEDAYNVSFVNSFKDQAPKVVPDYFVFKEDSVPIGTTDFRTEIAKLKKDFKADAIFITMQDTSSVGPFMKQLQEQGVTQQVYETPDAENKDNLTKFPNYFDGLRYVYPSYEDDKSYVALHKRFVEKYGQSASEGPAFVNAYNAATALFDVISQGARTGDEIADALAKVHVQGVGIKDLSFDQNGQVSGARYIMKEVKNNQFQIAK